MNGCFWHGCEKCNKKLPKRNAAFWRNKINGNKIRDLKNKKILEKDGWKVITIWECEINKNLKEVITDLQALIGNDSA